MSAPYQYIVLHKSCANRPGVAAAQSAHAACGAMRGAENPETHRVILSADSSAVLEAIASDLTVAGINHVVIREPDEPYNGTAVAVGVEPMERERIRGLLANFKAFR